MEIKVSKGKSTLVLHTEDDSPVPYTDLVLSLEKATISALLLRFQGIKARVATYLSMNRTTLIEKSRRHGFPLKGRD